MQGTAGVAGRLGLSDRNERAVSGPAHSISRSQHLGGVLAASVFGMTFCLLLSAPDETGPGPYVSYLHFIYPSCQIAV